jgi:hypothetical protein
MPAIVVEAFQNRLNPSIGPNRSLTDRWSCSMRLFKYFDDRRLVLSHDRRMGQVDTALSHHLDEISEAQFEPEIPTHTENNDLPIEMAALEELVNSQHAGLLSLRL